MSYPIEMNSTDTFTVGLAWDQNPQARPTDLDLACVAIGPTGLITDACFYNNPQALFGALRHSGDVATGANHGIDEYITVTPTLIPPSTYALVFVAMCQSTGDLSTAETAQLHVFSQQTQSALMHPVPLGSTLCSSKATFAVLGLSRRLASGYWAFETSLIGFPAPARTFMDVYSQLLPLVNIDPIMAQELKNQQPTFHLTKGGEWTVPMGMTRVKFGLGWESTCDVDASCIALKRDGTLKTAVYYGARNFNNVIVHSGDNRTGQGSGDDEVIDVQLAALPDDIESLFFTVNVFSQGYNFKDVEGEYCRLIDDSPGPNQGTEMVRFKALDNGKYNGVVLLAMHRNPRFPSQFVCSAVAYGASGRSCGDLIDECQMLQKKRFSRTLKVTLLGANNVPAMDAGGTSDPYCVIKNDKKKIFKTKTHKKTLNPVWNETVTFEINGPMLRFKIYDHDTFTKDDKIGIVEFNSSEVGRQPMTFALKINHKGKDCGVLNVVIEDVTKHL